ncbi:CHAP domain-containing protein [Spirillospora albida]|uniref:CHAP domain-containing protein n=1 Tax=Spirillospora albida TaxID=58123 RepID=UPI00068BAF8B|nr:CHAP domain-containing protein [Spirillospora albida]
MSALPYPLPGRRHLRRTVLLGLTGVAAAGFATLSQGTAHATPEPGNAGTASTGMLGERTFDAAPSDWLNSRISELNERIKTPPRRPVQVVIPQRAPSSTVQQGLPAQVQPVAPGGAATAQRIVATALGRVGEGEARDGTSSFGTWYGKYTRQAGFAAAPWCDMFLTWAAAQHGAQKVTGVFAYTPAHAAWFDEQGRFDRKPRLGDYVFFDWNGGRAISGIDHVGMVTAVNPDGSVSTVEGNISDKVVTRKRTMGTIVGFGHPNYPA